MASASNNVWRSYAGTMIRHIAERGDLHPLWRLIVLLIIIRLLWWVEHIPGFLSLESFHGTQGRYSARNLLNTIHCLVEFSLLFLLIQKSLEVNESFLFRYFDHLSLDLGGNLSRNLGVYSSCSNTLGLSLFNVLVRKVGCLQRREPCNNLLESLAWRNIRPTIWTILIELRTWGFTGLLLSLWWHSHHLVSDWRGKLLWWSELLRGSFFRRSWMLFDHKLLDFFFYFIFLRLH